MNGVFGNNIDDAQSTPEEDVFALDSGQVDANDVDGPGDSGQPAEPNPDTDQPNSLILGKFKDEEALANAYISLVETKLGREPEQFENVEELEKAYKQAEKELGSRGQKADADNSKSLQQSQTVTQQPIANQELQQLRMQNQYQQQQLQQAAQYLQHLQAQMAQQQQVQAQPPANQQQAQPVDPQKILDEFYENPTSVIQKMVEPLVEQRVSDVKKQYEQLVQQNVTPVQQYVAQQRLLETWGQQINELERSIPDFEEYRDQIMPEINKDPSLIQLINQNPNAMQLIVRTAYDRAKANRLQQQALQAQQQFHQQQNQQQQQQNVAQKKNARMTTGGLSRVIKQPKSQEEIEISQIFGSPNKPQGIFG